MTATTIAEFDIDLRHVTSTETVKPARRRWWQRTEPTVPKLVTWTLRTAREPLIISGKQFRQLGDWVGSGVAIDEEAATREAKALAMQYTRDRDAGIPATKTLHLAITNPGGHHG